MFLSLEVENCKNATTPSLNFCNRMKSKLSPQTMINSCLIKSLKCILANTNVLEMAWSVSKWERYAQNTKPQVKAPVLYLKKSIVHPFLIWEWVLFLNFILNWHDHTSVWDLYIYRIYIMSDFLSGYTVTDIIIFSISKHHTANQQLSPLNILSRYSISTPF